jgi:TnpA family transposase
MASGHLHGAFIGLITHWPDMLKVAGSLVTNQVHAYDLLRMFGRDGRPTALGAAFAEYGRIAKSEHLLRVVDPVDDTYRRQTKRQLTVQESRHKLARDVCPPWPAAWPAPRTPPS